MSRKAVDLVGQTFGLLLVTEFAGLIKGQRHWYCSCSCGAERLHSTARLRSNSVKSCGCTRVKHGGSINNKISSEYRSWLNIRMHHPHVEEWSSFTQFFQDVGWKPDDKYSLARHDINQPHGPLNTYWKNPSNEKIERRSIELADEFCLDMSSISDTYSLAGASDKT